MVGCFINFQNVWHYILSPFRSQQVVGGFIYNPDSIWAIHGSAAVKCSGPECIQGIHTESVHHNRMQIALLKWVCVFWNAVFKFCRFFLFLKGPVFSKLFNRTDGHWLTINLCQQYQVITCTLFWNLVLKGHKFFYTEHYISGDKIFKYRTCPAGWVAYTFHSSCKLMHLSFKSLCNAEHKGVICNMTSFSNSFQSTRPDECFRKNYSSFLDSTLNYERTSGIFIPCISAPL